MWTRSLFFFILWTWQLVSRLAWEDGHLPNFETFENWLNVKYKENIATVKWMFDLLKVLLFMFLCGFWIMLWSWFMCIYVSFSVGQSGADCEWESGGVPGRLGRDPLPLQSHRCKEWIQTCHDPVVCGEWALQCNAVRLLALHVWRSVTEHVLWVFLFTIKPQKENNHVFLSFSRPKCKIKLIQIPQSFCFSYLNPNKIYGCFNLLRYQT